MSTLLNFPFKNQLNEPDIDGIPDVNAGMNCLPTCIAAANQYITGKEYTGEEIEHTVYGANHRGGTAAVDYVSYENKQGVKLYAITSTNTDYLVQQAHAHLALGHPVICTIPSSYTPPADPMDPGESHCVVFYKDSPGVLIAMNPWQAFSQANSDAWWAARMCYAQVWVLERGGPVVPTGWTDTDPNDPKGTLTAPDRKTTVKFGFRAWVLAHNWRPDDIPLGVEFGTETGTEQDFKYTRLVWVKSTNQVQVGAYGPDFLALQSQVAQLKAEPQANLKTNLQAIDQSLAQIINTL